MPPATTPAAPPPATATPAARPTRRVGLLACLLLPLAGCPGGSGGGDAGLDQRPPGDGPVADGAGRDGEAPDFRLQDAQLRDATARDAATRDATASDAEPADARAVRDAEPTDAAADGGQPDGGEPDPCPPAVAEVDLERLDELTAAFAFAGHLDGARCAAERLFAVGPDHPLALSNLAFVLLEAGEPEAALDLLRPAAALWPDAAPLLQNLALAASRAGDHPAALDAAEALVELEPEADCSTEVVHAVVALRAGRGDEDRARQLIEGRCRLAGVWQRLVDEGLVAPAPQVPICLPVPQVPDRRSTCPSDGACREPVAFPVPDCLAHPEVCALEPRFRTYAFSDDNPATFGVITGSWVYAGTVKYAEVTCEGETDCFLQGAAAVPRTLQVSVAGPAITAGDLALTMPAEGALNVGGFWVVFPLFPQRVIHPSARAAELGCPPMAGAFYHFSGPDDLAAAMAETVERLEARGGLRAEARVQVVGLHPTFVWQNGYWDRAVCPQPPGLQCQAAVVTPPATGPAPLVAPSCAESQARTRGDFRPEGTPAIVALEEQADSIECRLPDPPAVPADPAALARALVTALLPEAQAQAVLFSVPGNAIEVTLDHNGTLSTTLRGGLFTVQGGVGLLDSAFDIRLGVGPTFQVGGLADFELTLGIGAKGDLGRRSIDSFYGVLSGSACAAERWKLSVDHAIDGAELRHLLDTMAQGFTGVEGGQVALTARP